MPQDPEKRPPFRRFQPDPALLPLMEEWRRIQLDLASRAVIRPLRPLPRHVAGVDSAFSRDGKWVLSAAVLYDRELKAPVEFSHASAPLLHPYIPGYLGFREGPAVTAALRGLKGAYGAVLFDGMGMAHPRRCGIAVQIAVTLDVPGIGVGKSRLYGVHAEPGPKAGDMVPLWDPRLPGGASGSAGDRPSRAAMAPPARLPEAQLGWVLRTRDGVRPVYVSVGHKADLDSARDLVLGCLGGYRLPEPTRLADKEVAAFKARWKAPEESRPGRMK